MSKRVLCIITDGFEEIETVAPVDLLRRAGAEVVVASLTDSMHVTGRCNVTLHADTTLAAVMDEAFDLLLIPGGPHYKALRADGRPARLAVTMEAAGKPVASICAAPAVLKDAGLLDGRRFSAHIGMKEELPDLDPDVRVVEDRNVITSRGAGTSVEFGLALVKKLFGEEKEREIARAILI